MQIQTTAVTIESFVEQMIFRALADCYCHRVGIIKSFDTTTLTATIQIVDKIQTLAMVKLENQALQRQETFENMSVITDCPIVITGGGGGFLNTPIQAGDECLVCFNDRDIDNWFFTGGVNVPNSIRMHDKSDAIAFVGLHNKTNPLSTYISNAFGLQYKNAKVMIDNSGKVDISNQSNTLKVLLQNLITTITAAKVLNPNTGTYTLTIDPATITALNTISTNLSNLLK